MNFGMNQTVLRTVLTLLLAVTAGAQDVGTSCADCPNYSGAFSIENSTGVTIHYQVKWGESRPWKSITLNTGQVETHSYPLGEDPHAKVLIPYVRFDRIGGDGKYTPQEYRMHFFAVGYAGYGPGRANTKPKAYYFQYGADRRTLNLFAR